MPENQCGLGGEELSHASCSQEMLASLRIDIGISRRRGEKDRTVDEPHQLAESVRLEIRGILDGNDILRFLYPIPSRCYEHTAVHVLKRSRMVVHGFDTMQT